MQGSWPQMSAEFLLSMLIRVENNVDLKAWVQIP